jgi:hypothetical protein
VLEAEPFAGAANAALDFVEQQQEFLFIAQGAQAGDERGVGGTTPPSPWTASQRMATVAGVTAARTESRLLKSAWAKPGMRGSKPL